MAGGSEGNRGGLMEGIVVGVDIGYRCPSVGAAARSESEVPSQISGRRGGVEGQL